VRTGLLQRKCACGGTPDASGECEECRKKRRQLKIGNPTSKAPNESVVPPIVHEVLRASGQPLDAATQAFMEPRFGHDFSRIPALTTQPRSYSGSLVIGPAHDQYEREADASASRVLARAGTSGRRADFGSVRIHSDSRAAESAHELGARAYTVGKDIVFGAGRYAPQTNEGRELLAHELTHVVQQTASAPAVLQGSPDEGKKEKGEEKQTTKFPACDKDQQSKLTEAIKQADGLSSRAVQALERYIPLSYEGTAMKAHFGSLDSDRKSTIIERYKHVQANLGSKTYTCDKKGKKAKQGKEIVDLCAQARCPGNEITVFPDFGTERCPAGPVILHEAAHNAGACGDIDKDKSYPPSSSEDNAYSYEYFALDVAAGYKTPELKKRQPTVPK
jgi:hypothetical protein